MEHTPSSSSASRRLSSLPGFHNCAPEHLRGTVGESYRLDCFARYMLANWPRQKIVEWLDKNPGDMRDRLNRLRCRHEDTPAGQV